MPTLHLTPTDTLYFGDGRPMEGSLSGHGAAWPAPHIINTALHAALHRADIKDTHAHRRDTGKNGPEKYAGDRPFKFGSLLTAGPYPIAPEEHWLFPTPLDLVKTKPAASPSDTDDDDTDDTTRIGFLPNPVAPDTSSLPAPLTHALAATTPPDKDATPPAWLRADAWRAYLKNQHIPATAHLADTDIYDHEQTTGIAIDPATGTTGQGAASGKIYTAHGLRLRDGWRLGVHAEALDKINGAPAAKRDLITKLFPQNGPATHIIIGGQQRLCSVKVDTAPLPFPRGLTRPEDFLSSEPANPIYRIKWVLLSPAIYPRIQETKTGGGTHIQPSLGGWLPNWIDATTGKVQLLDGPGKSAAKRRGLQEGKPIVGTLVAALVGKPRVVTGWTLAATANDGAKDPGAKPTQLAVPAGSIYYFTCETAQSAAALAAALNWHGPNATGATIRNRRSTLLGEKGYGLGICGTWQPHSPAPL